MPSVSSEGMEAHHFDSSCREVELRVVRQSRVKPGGRTWGVEEGTGSEQARLYVRKQICTVESQFP